jgi:soluble lytic murein transglycosylase-like protein
MGSSRKLAFGILLAVFCSVWAHAGELAVLQNGFTIRHYRHVEMGASTRLFISEDGKSFVDVVTSDIDHFEEAPPEPVFPTPQPQASGATALIPPPSANPAAPQEPLSITDAVTAASDRYQLDPDFLHSVIKAESGYNPKAISPKGARGLMQLMPQTASELGVQNAFDPASNVDGGTRYLRELLEKYNFDVAKALAAYNAGPQRVEQYHGIPPYRETRSYVARIIRDFNRKKLAAQATQKAHTAPATESPEKAAAGRGRATPTPTSAASATLTKR